MLHFLTTLRAWFRRSTAKPEVTAIYITTTAGEPMRAVTEVDAIAERGLKGDRYHDGNGFWRPIEACQVTLITQHELSKAEQATELTLDKGAHRRNIVVNNIKHIKLVDKRFKIGSAVFEYHKPRPPCGYLDKIEGIGMGKALRKKAGFCVKVIESGHISVGDRLHIL